jgi:hypothetical protein
MRSLAVALGLGSVLGMSCYSEPRPPSTYRYACDADGDCNANEVCRRGRCEVPCSTLELVSAATFGAATPCPVESGFATCVNGACVNTCALGSDVCPPDYTCLDVGIDGGGGGGIFSSGSDAPLGVCTIACDDELCPPGEACGEDGLCAPIECMDEPCPEGLACTFLGTCIPSCADGRACPDGFECSTLLPGMCEPVCEPACGDGKTCFFGACATSCEVTEDCPDPDEQACFFGICAPKEPEAGTDSSSGGEPSGTSSTGDSTSGGSTSGEAGTGGSSGGASTDGSTTAMGVGPADDEERR